MYKVPFDFQHSIRQLSCGIGCALYIHTALYQHMVRFLVHMQEAAANSIAIALFCIFCSSALLAVIPFYYQASTIYIDFSPCLNQISFYRQGMSVQIQSIIYQDEISFHDFILFQSISIATLHFPVCKFTAVSD